MGRNSSIAESIPHSVFSGIVDPADQEIGHLRYLLKRHCRARIRCDPPLNCPNNVLEGWNFPLELRAAAKVISAALKVLSLSPGSDPPTAVVTM
jgi:hypothetical protein